MKRRFLPALMAVVMVVSLVGCMEGGPQVIDTTLFFDKAIISLPNGQIIEGEVESWLDFENSDQLQVTVDGVTYLTHASKVVLVEGAE